MSVGRSRSYWFTQDGPRVSWSAHADDTRFSRSVEDEVIQRDEYLRKLRYVLKGLTQSERKVLRKVLDGHRLTSSERKTLSRLRATIRAAKPPL